MKQQDLVMILASCIHDMKNSLALILNSVDHLGETPKSEDEHKEHLTCLRYEASRLNNDLMNLLGAYRLKEQELPLIIDEHEVWETLHQQYLKNEALLKKYNIDFELDCDPDEIWYYDQELIGGVVNNILVNCARYTKDKMKISAKVKDNQLVISIADNGQGYPEAMLHEPDSSDKPINFKSGSTGLGLYFASQVAKLHKKAQQTGSIQLQNGGDLGGGIFIITLP